MIRADISLIALLLAFPSPPLGLQEIYTTQLVTYPPVLSTITPNKAGVFIVLN